MSHESSAIFPIITNTQQLQHYFQTIPALHRYPAVRKLDVKLPELYSAVYEHRPPFLPVSLRRYVEHNTKMEGDFWRLRELHRFCNHDNIPSYQPIILDRVSRIYSAEHTMDHFLHLSIQNPGYVSYTPSAELGREDRQVRTTFGRYLKKFFGHYSDHEIRDATNEFKSRYADLELHWAKTADEIENVYVNGPRSCMSYLYDYDGFGGHVHPSRAYEAPDMAVAYLVHKDNKSINARCLTYQKTYIRLYGDGTLLVMLKSLGYTQGHLEDARIARIPALHPKTMALLPETYVVPYIDDPMRGVFQYVELVDDERYLIVGEYKRDESLTGCGNTNGLVGLHSNITRSNLNAHITADYDNDDDEENNEDYRQCFECHEAEHMDDMCFSDHLDRWLCESCSDEYYVEAYVSRDLVGLVRREDTHDIVLGQPHQHYNCGFVSHDLDYDVGRNIPSGLVFIENPETLYTNMENATRIEDDEGGFFILSADAVTLVDGRQALVDDCFNVLYKRKNAYLLKDEVYKWALHLHAAEHIDTVSYREVERAEKQFVTSWHHILNRGLIGHPDLLKSLRTGEPGDYDFLQKNIRKFYERTIIEKTREAQKTKETIASSVITSCQAFVDFDQMA